MLFISDIDQDTLRTFSVTLYLKGFEIVTTQLLKRPKKINFRIKKDRLD
jgi:hypothetical protein